MTARPTCIAISAITLLSSTAVVDAGPDACPPRQTQKIVSPGAGTDDMFGLDVALLDGWLLAGAPLDDAAGSDVGAVYAYRFEDDAWQPADLLLPADPRPGQRFGWSLSVDPAQPGLVVVGSTTDDEVGPALGSAYVFTVDEEGAWTQQQKLLPTDLADGSWFGFDAALHGETLVVGAPFETNDIASVAGSAFVFTRVDGIWTETQKLLPTPFATYNGAIFGRSIDLAGDRLLIGASYLGNEFLPGVVEAFYRENGVWQQEQRFTGSLFTGRDRFGTAVRLLDGADRALIGAPRTPPPPNGIVHLHEYAGKPGSGGWTSLGFILSADPTYNDGFGAAIVIDGGRALIGAPNHDTTGAAFLYDLEAAGLVHRYMITPDDPQAFSVFGAAVAMAGETVAIGAPQDDDAAPAAGAVYIFGLDAGPADVDGDGAVNVLDLLALLAEWGGPGLDADVNGDGVVDVLDLLAVLAAWGACS